MFLSHSSPGKVFVFQGKPFSPQPVDGTNLTFGGNSPPQKKTEQEGALFYSLLYPQSLEYCLTHDSSKGNVASYLLKRTCD